MSKQQTITINGVSYDAHTGMRTESMSAPQRSTSTTAPRIHSKPQHSRTLNRSIVATPHPAKKPVHHTSRPAITKSPHISRFAPSHATAAPVQRGRVMSDIGPTPHPIVARKNTQLQRPAATAVAKPAPAHVVKQQAIEKALNSAKPSPKAKAKRLSFQKRHPRALSIASVSLAIVMLAGYLSYINMPNLSVRLAAAQAGIAASYPSYHPSGYSLSGPVAYASGQVSMQFAANAGPQNFTLRQTKSNWDSSAVLDNYVNPQSNGDYTTYTDGGLTIYTYGTNAAWVNGGILYTLSGNAELSNDQIRRLATSM